MLSKEPSTEGFIGLGADVADLFPDILRISVPAAPTQPKVPGPPAEETAAASRPPLDLIIGAEIIGRSIPSSSVTRVFSMGLPHLSGCILTIGFEVHL